MADEHDTRGPRARLWLQADLLDKLERELLRGGRLGSDRENQRRLPENVAGVAHHGTEALEQNPPGPTKARPPAPKPWGNLIRLDERNIFCTGFNPKLE